MFQSINRAVIPQPTIIRAVAIFCIVFVVHLCGYSEATPFNRTAVSWLLSSCCLGAFCFISGYLLAARYSVANAHDAVLFMKRRFLRIYPPYVIALAGFYAMGLADASACVQGALLVRVLTGNDLLTLWFANMIVLFYLLTPAFLYHYSTSRALGLMLAILIILGLVKIATHRVDMRFFEYLPLFVTGIAVARNQRLDALMRKKQLIAGLIPLMCILAYGSAQWRQDKLPALVITECARFVTIPLFWGLAMALSRTTLMPAFNFVSYCAFALYLLHRITFGLGLQWYQPTGTLRVLLYMGGVLAPCTLLLSWCFQAGYDRLCGRVAARGQRLAAGAQDKTA